MLDILANTFFGNFVTDSHMNNLTLYSKNPKRSYMTFLGNQNLPFYYKAT